MSDQSLSSQERAIQIQMLMNSNNNVGQNTHTADDKNSSSESQKAPTYFMVNNQETEILGCKHYKKNCKVKAPCCQKFFTCRRCHDEAVMDHKINRYEIETMMCMICFTTQEVSQTCTNCHKVMAQYYCNTCKFFDDDADKCIWHCDKCGLCRVGAKENFYHCDTCHMCVSASTKGHTRHIERAFEANCPICGEYMQTSTTPSFQPDPCQHAIHSKCYKKYLREGNFSCPICSRTYRDLENNMKQHWQMISETINGVPMPSEYKDWKVEILCNDCNIKSECAYHMLGHACSKCGSFNNKITRTMRP